MEYLPDDLFATTWTPEETRLINQLILGQGDHEMYGQILNLIRHAVKHIEALQDKALGCDAGCNCACDFDAPGDMCVPHYEYGAKK